MLVSFLPLKEKLANYFVFIIFILVVAYSFLMRFHRYKTLGNIWAVTKSQLRRKLRKKGFGNLRLLRGNFSCEAQLVHLASSGSQWQRQIWFMLLAHGASHKRNQLPHLSSCLAFNYNTLKVNLAPSSSNITQIFFEKKNITWFNPITTHWYFLSHILKVQPTSFSPTTDEDLLPSAFGKKTMPCGLNIYCRIIYVMKTLRNCHGRLL